MTKLEADFTRINFGIVSRAQRNGNAVKTSAYLASDRLEHDGKVFDFRRKAGEYKAGCILLPEGAPESYLGPEVLWTAAEAAERRIDAQVARQVLLSIPRECPPDLHLDLATTIVAPWVADGMAAQIAIHRPLASDGQEQPHAHVQLTLRRLGADGFDKKKAVEWNQQFRENDGRAERSRIADRANLFFREHGLDIKLDPRSLAAQGIDRPLEPIAPQHDWQRWLREGARPEAAPITVAAVFEHRHARAGWEQATAIAKAAEEETAELEIQIATIKLENAWRIEAALRTEAPPRNNQKEVVEPVRNKISRAAHNKEDTDMAKKPTRTPRKIESWMRAWGSDALSDAQQAAAKKAYERWLDERARAGKKSDQFSLTSYIAYVQDARRREEYEAAEAAAEAAELAVEADNNATSGVAPVAPVDQPNAITPTSVAAAQEQRRTHLQSLLAERYQAPEGLESWCRRIEVDPDGRRAVLHGEGGRLIDHGDGIAFEGETFSPALATATVSAAHGHGWRSLKVTGSAAYKDAVSWAAALHEPPLQTDHALSRDAAAQVQQQLRQRAVKAVPGLPDLAGQKPDDAALIRIDRERALTQAILSGEPRGLRDPRAISSPQVAELVSRRNTAREDAVESTAAADAHRAAYPWSARLLGAVRRRQAALDTEANRQDAEARRLDREHERSVRRIEKSAKREALENTRRHEDWTWSPETRKAQTKLRQLDALQAAVKEGNPVVTEAVAAGDSKQAQQALKASTAEQEAMRLASLTPAQQRDAALRKLAEHEHAAGMDSKKMMEARAVTAAAIAGDPAVLAAAAAGDLVGASQAAEAFRKRQKDEEAERRRERDRILDAQMQREAAQDAGLTGPG